MNATSADLLMNELTMVEWELNAIANPIGWRKALEIGELDCPKGRELLAKFYELQT